MREAVISFLAPGRHRLDWRIGVIDQRLISSADSLSPKAGIWVAGRPSRITFSASALRRRARFSGSSAGPMPPRRASPWQDGAVLLVGAGGIGRLAQIGHGQQGQAARRPE